MYDLNIICDINTQNLKGIIVREAVFGKNTVFNILLLLEFK